MIPDGIFRPGLELMTYLDGNLSSNGLDDPALDIRKFYLSWWTPQRTRPGPSDCLSSGTIKAALEDYRKQVALSMARIKPPFSIRNLADELNKPAYTWHSSAYDEQPNTPSCTRCRLYRAVAVGVMDQLRDTYNMVRACEVANEGESDIAMRRASGFNELFDAVVKKEYDLASVPSLDQAPDAQSGSGKGKEKQRFGPEVGILKELTKKLVREGGERGSSKWISGVCLTADDLLRLIRGADCQNVLPHSGYDAKLASGPLRSASDIDTTLESPSDEGLRFDTLSKDIITTIPDLSPSFYPRYLDMDVSGQLHGSARDRILNAFAKRVKVKAKKTKKLIMQEEVDQPTSFFVGGPEFDPRVALMPRRPWLMPRLPFIIPPTLGRLHVTNTDDIVGTESAADDAYPDHIEIPDSGEIPDHIEVSGSDDPRHIDIPNSPGILMIPESESSASSDIYVHDSDDAMDVVPPDEQTGASANNSGTIVIDNDTSSDSVDDHIELSSDHPNSPDHEMSDSAVIGRFGKDPATGRFTAASFANVPDDMVD